MKIYEYQLKKNRDKLLRLIKHSKENIKFYSEILDDCEEIVSSYESWCRLPIISKKDLQENGISFIESEDRRLNRNIKAYYTSGSSGKPLTVLKDIQDEIRLTKKLWETRRLWNKNIMSWKLLYLYRDLESNKQNVLRIGNHNDYLDLSKHSMELYIKEITRFSPQWMIGPPIVATRLANYYNSIGETISTLKFVELYGEMLLPYQRNLIENTFNCKVINHYGCREAGVMSYECLHCNMHSWEDEMIFEVLKDGKPVGANEEGELVVTVLSNTVMPLIRYSVGDIVKLTMLEEKCLCGNEGKLLLEPREGRISDIVITPNKIITSGIFDTIFSRFITLNPDTIKEFQIIQEEVGVFSVNLVIGDNYSPIFEKELVNKLLGELDDSRISLHIKDRIHTSNAGKTKTFIAMSNYKV